MINEEKDIKISEIDVEELENIMFTEIEVTRILRNLAERGHKVWKRLASQFNFDIEKDVATYDTKTKTIGISRCVKNNE